MICYRIWLSTWTFHCRKVGWLGQIPPLSPVRGAAAVSYLQLKGGEREISPL
jgi:hypothetical protein